jgi:hypothetical protein
MGISGLTESGMSGKIISPKIDPPALPDVRPAPQAGCFVSRLYVSYATADSGQITLWPIEHDGCFGPFCQ